VLNIDRRKKETMKTNQVFDWRIYSTSMEVLHGAIQQMGLVPLDEMEHFLHNAIEATVPDSELSKKKIKAAKRQLDLISVSQRYMSEVKKLLGDDVG
jgi:hypothetical protein